MATVRKNFVYNTILTTSNILFPIISFPYASRILGPEGIGKVQFVSNFVQYFVLVAGLGIPVYGIREVAKRRENAADLNSFISQLIILNIATSLVMSMVYLAIVCIVPSLFKDFTYYLIACATLVLSFCNVDWLFSGLEKFRFITLRSVIVKAISLVALFFLVRTGNDKINYLWIIVGTVVLNNLWNIWSARAFLFRSPIVIKDIKKHLLPLFFIFSTFAAVSIYTILDTIILGFLTNDESVGYYTAASRLNKLVIPLLISLGTVLIPQISQAFKENQLAEAKRLIKESLNFIILAGIPITVGLIAVAPELVVIFSGAQFVPAITTMQLFAPAILIIALSNVLALQTLTPAGRDKYVTVSVLGGVVFSLIANFVLIRFYGFNGAAVANVLTEIIVLICLFFFTRRVIKIDFDFRLFIQSLLSSLLFFPIAILSRMIVKNIFWGCGITIIASVVVYGVLQLFVFRNENLVRSVNIRKK
ncbi:flippase [Deminuibacter soli]|uniref:Flippase n=1 Tax=Deminuibacter soli TaxID=2291815 RepID=A0A3E1NFV1_9BACT|nr:flippase [Deminuibacter soli]RFM26668.1 flippase [Deminuibacter soli]